MHPRIMFIRARNLLVGLIVLLTAAQTLPVRAADLPDFTAIVQQASSAVVNIRTTKEAKTTESQWRIPDMPGLPEDFNEFFKRFFEQQPGRHGGTPAEPERSLGSGFIISPDGYILTNAHVVKGAERIVVRLVDHTELPAKLVGLDERTDVALLKVSGQRLPTVSIGDSNTLKVGQWVLAKRLIWFEQSAHNPPFEEPEKFVHAMIDQVLPLVTGKSKCCPDSVTQGRSGRPAPPALGQNFRGGG